MIIIEHTFVETFAPEKLLLYDLLHTRTQLSPKYRTYHERMLKGYLGEKTFGEILHQEKLQNIIPLSGLLFEVDHTEVQLDFLLITNHVLFLIEIKNYDGDYYVQDERIFSLHTKLEIRNPLRQIERSTILVKQLLNELGINMEVRSYVVFTNTQFMLYEAPIHLPIIFPTQVRRFLRKINANASPLNERHERIALQLTSRHKEQSFYERRPTYHYEEMKKGTFCLKCRLPLRRLNKLYLICTTCGENKHINEAILQEIASFYFLFPNTNITPKIISEWCGETFNIKTVRKVLRSHLDYRFNGKYSYYFFNNKTDVKQILMDAIYQEQTSVNE